MRNTTNGAEVVYVDGDGSYKKATISEVVTQGAVIVELSESSHANAIYSENGEPGTFHYPDQKDLVKENAKALKKSPPPVEPETPPGKPAKK